MYKTPEFPAPMGCIIDTHAHFNDPKFDEYRDELLSSLPSLGVEKIINCGCSDETSLDCIALAEKYPHIYAAVGYHPCSVEGNINIEAIEKMLSHEKVVAVGEIGLDYYWVKDNRDLQIEIFEKQILLARELDLPIIVHDRDAHGDTLEILKKYKPKGVVHCFSGSVETAREVLDLGMYIGFTGVVTFKNAAKSKASAAYVPLDRLLIETDCPYMAPEPHRGKRNDSSLLVHVIDKIAEIKQISTEELKEITTQNAYTLFPRCH